MTDTPKTDAAVKASDGQWSFALKETFQRLERERNDARSGLEFLRKLYIVQNEKLERIERERDDLREQVDRYREKLDLSPMHWEV